LCDRVVALSRGNWYQYSIRRLGEGKLRVIHNGIDLNRVPPPEKIRAVREAEGWDDSQCHVVSVGRLADQKRIDWLLRSWRIVQEKRTGARLWIVGSGLEEEMLRRLAGELAITETCTFLGSRPNGIEYMAAGDIAAMTTLFEGHSIAVLEALACGRPLVVNDVDGTHDSLDDAVEGFLVPPADIELFAARLIELIDDAPLRKQMGEAGRARAAQFSIAKMSGEYLELVREVMGGRMNNEGAEPKLRPFKLTN
jgi:glycosyltransferase involved in cell wall biosynthesis